MLGERDPFPFGEGGLVVWEFEGVGPVGFRGSTHDLEDFEDLVDFRVTREQCPPLSHLRKDTSNRPYVHRGRILFLAEEYFRSPVPEGNNFMSVSFNGQPKGSCQAEVCQLDHAVFVDQ